MAKDLLRDLTKVLRTEDTFNIVTFSGGDEVFSEQPVRSLPEEVERARNFIDKHQAGGGTELGEALKTAMNLPGGGSSARSIVVVTDGFIGFDKEVIGLIRSHLGMSNLFAFGIGTSEVEMVLSSQCIMQPKPKKMLINVNGKIGKGVTPKDVVLYIISQLTAAGATGYFIEYAGEVFRDMSMEGRMTVCNMSIEMGARGGMIAPDETTFAYIKGREKAPQGEAWDKALAYWKTLKTESRTSS